MEDLLKYLSLAEDSLVTLFVFVIFIEQLTQYAKTFITNIIAKTNKDIDPKDFELKPEFKTLISVIVSMVVCMLLKVPLHSSLNINEYLNYLLAALVCSGGSQGWHSMLTFIRTIKQQVEETVPNSSIPKK
jgi:hypothetical protein